MTTLLALVAVLQAEPKLAPIPRPRHKFIVVAHRGYHLSAPENSIHALQESIRVGADYMEIDLHTTKDGAIVLMHDGTVNRTTDGTGTIRSLTLDQIKALHFKKEERPDEKVPTFDEILTASKGKIGFYLDIKDVTPEQVVPILKKHHMEKSVVVYLYSNEEIEAWRKCDANLPIIADCSSDKDPDAFEAKWRQHPYEISDGNAFEYTKEIIDRMHKLGIKVWPDIQNAGEAPAQWGKVLPLGVDGFQSDHPEALAQWLHDQKRR